MGELKVCPRCQHKSSQAKNYCDRCGSEFALQTPAPAPDAGIPQTLVVGPAKSGGTAPAEPGFSLPQAGRSEQVFAPIPTPAPRAAAKTLSTSKAAGRAPASFSLLPNGLGYFARSVASILVILALVLGAALLALQQLQARSPKAVVKRAAQRYLGYMAAGDYVDAYEMLSGGAKAACKQEDFRLLMAATPWTWSNVRVVHLEPDAAVVEYELAEPGKPPRPDFLSFAVEGESWVRPFDAVSVQAARNAIETGHADMGFLKAQEAISIDPRDPVARALLCEASYARRQPDEIERECGVALEAARKYPSALGAAGLYRIYALLAETLHSERQFSQAAEAYTAMLGFPQLSGDDVCRLSLARADAYANLGHPGQAAADLDRAVSACPNPADKAAALRQKAALARSGGR